MKQQASVEQIKSKVNLVLVSSPTQGVDMNLLITITREFLKDDSLVATRVDVQSVIEAIDIPTRKVGRETRYFATAAQMESYYHGKVI
jgi:hypothetical protein